MFYSFFNKKTVAIPLPLNQSKDLEGVSLLHFDDKVNLSTVEIEGEGEKLKVESPYSPLFVERARELGGEWLSKYKAWYFNPKDISRVKNMCNEVYGTFGNPVETVDIEVSISDFSDRIKTLYLKGIKVAERRSRDNKVKLYNTIVKQGGFPSKGGSRNYPLLEPQENTILEVRDIPKKLAKKLVEENEDSYKIIRENEGISEPLPPNQKQDLEGASITSYIP